MKRAVKKITLYLALDHYEWLRLTAFNERTSMSKYINMLIKIEKQKHPQKLVI